MAKFLPKHTAQLISPNPSTTPSKPESPAFRAANLSLVIIPARMDATVATPKLVRSLFSSLAIDVNPLLQAKDFLCSSS